jgi:hypothetical protein
MVHNYVGLQSVTLPEAAYTTTSGGRMSLGVGDLTVNLHELNAVVEL